ncbi:glycosyltransferase family 39 protein [Micromonospora craniellae]|uniref:glycosyltransferase family 39 protein n=1 Tax=Micromonospora craniellae TaxID=2294034 RepID=UPI001CC3F2AB|nr:glycosyltransferase family 39 protein [Micromonospora craniellae]
MGYLSDKSVPAAGTGVRLSGLRLRGLPVWLLPTGLTLLVTLAGLDSAQPWRDELATWSAATRPVTDLLRLTGTIDAAAAPYYLLVHAWTAVAGDSVAALRLPSALAMAAAAGLTATLGRRLWDARVGTLAGLLFAVLPSTSRYGQEARPYALATALAVGSTLLLVDALHRPAPRRWAGYAVTTAALGLTHLVALTLLAAHAVAVLTAAPRTASPGATTPPAAPEPPDRPPTPGTAAPGTADPASPAPDPSPATGGGIRAGEGRRRFRRRVVWGWAFALVPVFTAVAPLALRARGQRARQLDWVDAARPGDLAALPGGVVQSGVVGGLLIGLAALGTVRTGRRALLPASCVLLPVLLLFLAGSVVPLWVPRYLVFVVPFGCLLAGAALRTVRAPGALAVVALAALLGLPDQAALRRTHEWPRSATVDYQGAAQIVADGRRPGDAVVYSPRESWLFLDLGLRYHLGERIPRDVLAVADPRRRGDLWATECDRPTACLAGVDRIWLVVAGRSDDPLTAVPGAKGDALRTGWTVTRVWPRPGLTVALLTADGRAR